MQTPALLAVDWGTTALRGALLAAEGTVLDELAAPRGLLSVPAGGWSTTFDELFGAWRLAHPGLPALLSGMVGSRQGWLEAPYCECPAALADLAARLAWVRPGEVAIVPGVVANDHGLHDVMRGEEVQVFGALALLGLKHADAVTLVLPGTHSKWVRVQRGRIMGLATQMTGECYALFRQHSILARTLPAEDDPQAWDGKAFDAGVDCAQTTGGLLHHLFGVRTQALFGQREGAPLASYLSGLVIGEELRAQAPAPGQPLVLMGSPGLVSRYSRALARHGVAAQAVGAEATWCGLAALAGLLDLNPA